MAAGSAEMRAPPSHSLVTPQRRDRVDARHALRWKHRRKERYATKDDHGDDQRWLVGGTHAEQQSSHEPRPGKRRGDADSKPEDRGAHALTNDQTRDISRPGAERHANADLVGAARDGVRHHAV